MKSALGIILVLVFGSNAWAVAQGKLTGLTGMINISQSYGDSSDPDAITLYNDMKSPVQDSFLGKGKVIKAADNSLNFICSEKGNRGVPACSIFIQRSPRSILKRDQLGYRVDGEEAMKFSSLFNLNSQNIYSYKTIDGTFRVYASEKLFYILWDASGVQ